MPSLWWSNNVNLDSENPLPIPPGLEFDLYNRLHDLTIFRRPMLEGALVQASLSQSWPLGMALVLYRNSQGEEYDKVFNHLDMLHAPLEEKFEPVIPLASPDVVEGHVPPPVMPGDVVPPVIGEDLNTLFTLIVPLNATILMIVYPISNDDEAEKKVDIVFNVASGSRPGKKKKTKSKKTIGDAFGASTSRVGAGDEHLEEIHVTWTQFEKKRYKITTLHEDDQEMAYSLWRRRHNPL
ncbi:hypothetical protein Tco_0858572 [Tanacetum coccineum]|uniref:Uncharacterized protein n=1 Tax=Tanacetum coccineum TaxID=301880 RepID=A0ABQ5B9M4_9ASTR